MMCDCETVDSFQNVNTVVIISLIDNTNITPSTTVAK